MAVYNGYLSDSLFVNLLARSKYLGEPLDTGRNAFVLKNDSKGSAWRSAIRWSLSFFWISGIRSVLGYPFQAIDVILIIVGVVSGIVVVIGQFMGGAIATGIGTIIGYLINLLIIGTVGFFLGRNTYVVDLPVNALAPTMVVGTVITDTTENKELLTRENLKWKVPEKWIPRDKKGNLIPDSTVLVAFKLSKFPKMKEDHEYQLKLPIDIGQFNATLVYKAEPGNKFIFQGME